MKKLISLLLALVCCFQISVSFAETTQEEIDGDIYLKEMPYYYEMQEDRILIGKSFDDVEIYEFEFCNPIYDYSGCFKLMTVDEVEAELIKRGIAYTNIGIRRVMAHDFLTITLIDNETYGLDLFYNEDKSECFITMDSLRVFCRNYFGPGYDFFGI